MNTIRYILRRVKLFFIYRVLHVNDTPHRIALAVAIGIFVAWTPTIGLQMLLTVLLAALFGANKLVGVPFVWISNPVTMVPIYGWCNYNVGTLLLGADYPKPDFSGVLSASGSWWLEAWVNRVQAWWEATWRVFAPMWLGSVVVGLLLAVATYFAVRYVVIAYRKRRHITHPHRRKLPI